MRECIHDEVAEQLLHAFAILCAGLLCVGLQLDLATGVSRSEFPHRFGGDRGQVGFRGHHPDAQAQLDPVEIQQVIEQGLHARAASDQPACRLRNLLAGIEHHEVLRGHLDGLQRAAHVVTEHAQHQIARLVDLSAEMIDRFGQCLIDRLVEADHVVKVGLGSDRVTLRPQAQYAGSQSPVLGRQLLDIKTAAGAQNRVGLGRSFPGIEGLPRLPLGFVKLLPRALLGPQIRRHGLEDLVHMVAQRK
jgi:hypothetical protein